MMNIMEINGVKAVIAFFISINMFRGEFVDSTGALIFTRLISMDCAVKGKLP